ncbi:hypothetical protein FGRMN_7708 [Fusarium graminum]|nr:hypothetical protein FGRMN_7708 [Fusarium graminum]
MIQTPYSILNHRWVIAQAATLLQDRAFKTFQCANTLTRLSSGQLNGRAGRREVLTVDKAQGNQADVVFLDLVRINKPGFIDEPQRLNVAITRARQAEIILMYPGMITMETKDKEGPSVSTLL